MIPFILRILWKLENSSSAIYFILREIKLALQSVFYCFKKSCEYDGGDCCPSTCKSTDSAKCITDTRECINPEAADYPYADVENCAGTWRYINDGYCDKSNNNADCGEIERQLRVSQLSVLYHIQIHIHRCVGTRIMNTKPLIELFSRFVFRLALLQ